MEFFTGISILCSMKQNWNENVIEKMLHVIELVIGGFVHVSIENGFYYNNLADIKCKYNVHFTISCDVSSNVEKEQKRCNLLLFVLKKVMKESFYAEVCLNGDYLLSMAGEDVIEVTKEEIAAYSK